MTELDPSTRALLDLGREGDDPTERVVARNRRALSAKLGAAALSGGVVAGATSQAVAAGTVAWTSSKIAAVCAALLVGGALTFGALRGGDESAAPVKPVVSSRSAVAAAPAALEPRLEPSSEPAAAPTAALRPRAAPSSRPAAARSIRDELELMRGAQRLLSRNDARAALALLNEHAQRFPGGALAEEREASRVLALCKLGNAAAARASADAFVKRSPHSPFVDRVRDACRAPSGARSP